MISFLPPDDFTLPMPYEIVAKLHMEHTEAKIREALIARFGELPPLELIQIHCICLQDKDGTCHYAWIDEPGTPFDPASILCSISPPKV